MSSENQAVLTDRNDAGLNHRSLLREEFCFAVVLLGGFFSHILRRGNGSNGRSFWKEL